MTIEIHNYLSGSYLLEQQPGRWDAIVVLDSNLSSSDFVAEHTRSHLFLKFDDVEIESGAMRAPVLQDVRAALEFASKSENLMLCCRAGQSRSAALAFVICYTQSGRDAAVQMLNPKRHIPNQRIIDLGSLAIDDTELRATFDDWQSRFRHMNLSDYFDEIEEEYEQLEQAGAVNRIVET